VRVAVGVERENVRHRPQRQVVRTEIDVRLAAGAIDFRQAQARLQRRHDSGRELLVGSSVISECAIETVRRQVAAGFGIDQTEDQACCRSDPRMRPVKW